MVVLLEEDIIEEEVEIEVRVEIRSEPHLWIMS